MSRGVAIPPVGSWPTVLERERCVRGLTYEAIAERARVSHWTVSRACRGERTTFATATRIAAAIKSVTPDPELVALYGVEGAD